MTAVQIKFLICTCFIVLSVITLIKELKGHSEAQKERLSLHPGIKHKAATPAYASGDAKKTQVGACFKCNCKTKHSGHHV